MPPREAELRQFADDLRAALGSSLLSVVLYGSAAGDDWIDGISDVNTAIVLERVDVAALDRLAPLIGRWRRKGFALPLVVDTDYLRRACESYPMEIEDLRRRHRVLTGTDPFAQLAVDAATLRRELEQEAAGKLLRLRAFYLEHAGSAAALDGLMLDSIKSFLVLLRHLLHLRGIDEPHSYAEVLDAGESLLGPLPALRRVHARRSGRREARENLADLARAYVAEVERLVAAAGNVGG